MGFSGVKKFKIRKVDSRSRAYGLYEFQIQFYTTPYYLAIRNWCWDNWGPSCEYDFLKASTINSEIFNDSWCFQTEPEYSKFCLYLKDEEALMLFQLRWVGDNGPLDRNL